MNCMKYYRVSKAAEIIGVSASSLRRYTNEGRIASSRNPANQRVYSQVSIDEFLGRSHDERIVFYVRSSDGDQRKMAAQVALLTESFGEPLRVYRDKASGLNENRAGLLSLLNGAENGKFNKVIITQKDRLTRFGYSFLEKLLKAYGVTVVVLGETEPKSLHDELLQDFMSLIASFSGKFYRLRGYEQQGQLLQKAGEVIEEKKGNIH